MNGGLNNVRNHSGLLPLALEEAARKDEAALWCDSYNINMSCRNFIQDKAMTAMNSRELDSFIGELVRFYGGAGNLCPSPAPSSFPIGIPVSIRRCLTGPDRPISQTPGRRGMKNHVDPTTRYVTEIDPCCNAIFMKLMELEEEQEATAQMGNDGQAELDEDMALEL